MSLQIFKDYHSLSLAAADKILSQVRKKPASVLCLAAGDTPRLAYGFVVKSAALENIDFSKCYFVGLDEWLGIPPDNEGSCFYFLQHNLFGPLRIKDSQRHVFNALTKDPAAECLQMDEVIKSRGGIDLMLVGVGMNGHIGFNEPGVQEDLHAHVVELDETTRSVGQKYFKQQTDLTKGITLGMQHLLESTSVLMMASGSKKADIIRQALEGDISSRVPASIVRKHRNAYTMLDLDAAALLTKT